MTYALVVNGSIETIGLPENGELRDGKTVSNYNRLPDSVLREEGWMPVVDSGPPVHDPDTHSVSLEGYAVKAGSVEPTYKVSVLPPHVSTDRETIPADGTTFATVTYYDGNTNAPASVKFNVNGVTATAAVTNRRASVEVASNTPGQIEVAVDVLPGQNVTIKSEGV